MSGQADKSNKSDKQSRNIRLSIKILLFILALMANIGLWLFGILPVRLFEPFTVILFVLFVGLLVYPKLEWPVNILLVVTITFSLFILVDIFLRVYPPRSLYYRPHDRFINRCPSRPYLSRYKANAVYTGEVCGDLAAMSGVQSLQEKRQVIFLTDEFGFRNDPDAVPHDINVIVLGDSFGVGNGTTQAATWASLLSSQYALGVYNLSLPGGLWEHSMNLQLEYDRLNLKADTIILLTLFTGNDLDETKNRANDLSELPPAGQVAAFKTSLRTFKNRSPIKQQLDHARNPATPDQSAFTISDFSDSHKMVFYNLYKHQANRSKQEVLSHPKLKKFLSTLSALQGFCLQRGLELKIVLFPTKLEVYQWVAEGVEPGTIVETLSGFSEVLTNYCLDNKIDYIDLKPFLVKGSRDVFIESQKSVWYYDDTHLNEIGHTIAAEAIYCNMLNVPDVLR